MQYAAMQLGAAVLAIATMAAQRPAAIERPSFVFPPTIVRERDELRWQVRIVPHPTIRAVIVEAWELGFDPDDPDGDGPAPAGIEAERILRRSSAQEVNALDARRRIFLFLWRPGLDAGRYDVVAVLELGRWVRLRSAPTRLIVNGLGLPP